MAEQELSILVRLRDEATAQLRQINAEIKSNASTWQESFGAIKGQMQSASIMFAGLGAAITGMFGLSYKAYENERVQIALLSNQLKNVGVSYDNVKASLIPMLEQTQKLTNYSRSEQMAAISKLTLLTGNYNDALKYLPLTLNLAAAGHMDLEMAAKLFGRVLQGDISVLQKYIGDMDGAKTSAQALDWMQKNLANSAEKAKKPLDELTNSINDLQEAIGGLVSKPITDFINGLIYIIDAIKDWTEANPELASALAEVGLAVGIAALVIGGAAGAIALVLWAIGLIGGTVAIALGWIGALIAIGILMALNWDWVKEHWVGIWMVIKAALVIALGPIGYLIGLLIQSAFDLISHWDSSKGLWANIWNFYKIIVRNAVNDIIGLLNLIPMGLNWLLDQAEKAFGKLVSHIPGITEETKKMMMAIFSARIPPIPELTEAQMGIFGKPPGMRAGEWPEEKVSAPVVPSLPGWGTYGGLGKTYALPGGMTINVNVEGSVTSEQDLMEKIRQAFIYLGKRNATAGIP